MANASGLRTELAYIAESTLGTTPTTPTLKLLRPTSRNINLTKNLMESAEVASHGDEMSVRHGFNRIDGQIGGEMLTGAWDDWIEAGLGGSWTSAYNITSVSISATAPGTFTRASGSFLTDGVKPGDVIKTNGFAAPGNNGFFIVLTVVALTITVAVASSAPLITQAGGNLTFVGRRAEQGLNLKGFSMERRFPDITQYQPFVGVTANTFAVSIQPEQIPTFTWGIVGLRGNAMSGTTMSSGGAPTAAAAGSPYSSFEGAIMFNGAVVGVITGMELNVNLNRALQPVVGSKYSPDIFEGRRQTGGSMTAIIQDAALYNYFVNETEIPVGGVFYDPNGVDFQSFYMPRVKLTGAPMDPGQQGPVLITSPFRALRDTTRACTLSWLRSNAT